MQTDRLRLSVTMMFLCREEVNLALPQPVAATAGTRLMCSADYTNEITHLANGAT